MTEDWDELMSAPGGENHGRKRGAAGWKSLENRHQDELPFGIEDPEYRTGLRRVKEPWEILHGTRSAYVNDGCRCADCKCANREYIRLRRSL